MPMIRVEARDKTQRHLKIVLENLSGKASVPLSTKGSIDYISQVLNGRNAVSSLERHTD
jgi:hypothetical protein